jgi:serine/threonine protein kinase
MRLPELPGYKYQALLEVDPFGWRYLALHHSGEPRVIKVLKTRSTSDAMVQHYREIFGNPSYQSPGVAETYEVRFHDGIAPTAVASPLHGWQSRETGQWQLSTLKRLSAHFSSEQSVAMIRELATILSGLHQWGLFHGGLRPANLFLCEDAELGQRLKIGDFGQIFMGGLQYLEAGDLAFYAAPEQIATGDFSGDLGKKWDIYAFGVIAFQMLTGHLPRLDRLWEQCRNHESALEVAPVIVYGKHTEVSEHFLAQLEDERSIEWPDRESDPFLIALRKQVEACLQYDPARRPRSMVDVAAEIERAWRAPVEKPVQKPAQTPVFADQAYEASAPVILPVEAPPERPVATVRESIPQRPPTERVTPRKLVPPGYSEANYEPAFVSAPAPAPAAVPASWDGTVAQQASKQPPATTTALALVESPAPPPSRSSIWWKVAAVFAILSTPPLAYFSITSYIKLNRTESLLTKENQETEASIQKQAEAYRRVLAEKQQSSEQMKAEIDKVEDSQSRLLGEAKLARQILRQTQDNGDEFFRMVLENRDSDVPGFREERQKALQEGRVHYERLVEVYGDAPDFLVSTANALFFLGQIYRELGKFGEALASFAEAERRYLALLDDSKSTDVKFIRNLAVAKNSLGQLSLKSAKYAVARHYFTESSRYWAEARAQDATEHLTAEIHIHENSLSIAECELAMGHPEAALDGARSIGVALLKLQEESPHSDRVIGALARSFSLVGQMLESKGDVKLAQEAYQQASDLYGEAVKLNSAIDQYRLGLGNSLAKVGLLTNDLDKLKASAAVLTKVVAANPFEESYLITLANVFGVLARNQRDGGQLKAAIAIEKEAIDILQPLVKNTEAPPSSLLFSYSQRLAHLAELQGDAGSFDDSRVPLQEAIALLERVNQSESPSAEYQRGLARARGLAGFACLKAGNKSEAKEHLALAKMEWDTFVAANPEDTDAKEAARWTADQLKGLP